MPDPNLDQSQGDDFPAAFDPRLFTPGPLTTSLSVKQAMVHDIGAWDAPLRSLVREIRTSLLDIADTSVEAGWECVLMQGSGSFSVESAVVSLSPHSGRFAVVSNGAYGERMVKIAQMAGIDVIPIRFAEDEQANAGRVSEVLESDASIHTVGIIHCETTTGLINDIDAVGKAVRQAGRRYMVDAMSSFGAYPIDLEAIGADVLISSANKCIEGVPGFGFVLARRELLEEAGVGGWARSHCMDLYDQWVGFQTGGKFRFTPPNQILLGFRQALREFFAEGGVAARQVRYQANHKALLEGMARLGFVPFLPQELMSHIITTFYCPSDPKFDFDDFYNRLSDLGMVIYPGKVTGATCFRIGNIGRLFPKDIEALLLALEQVVRVMDFEPSRVERVTPATVSL